MPVTVAEMLQLPVMADAQVVAGHGGLGKNVRWVHVTELLDIARLLHGGELLLTTGLALTGPPEQQRSFVYDLDAIGAAGIALELVRNLREVPPALAAAAEEVGLPVIVFVREVSFVKVTEAAHSLIINRQYAQIRAAESAAATLNGIALRQEGMVSIISALSKVLGNPVICLPYDPREAPLLYPANVFRPEGLEALRGSLSRQVAELETTFANDAVRTISTPIFVGHEHWGNLLVPELQRRITEPDALIVDRAAITIAFEILRQRSAHHQWHTSTGELLEDILAGTFVDPREVMRRARELGISLEDGWFSVITVKVTDSTERSRLEKRMRTIASQLGGPSLQAVRGDRVRLLVAGREIQTLSDRVTRLLAAVDRPAGTGRPFSDLSAAPRALEQAEYTLALRLRYPDARFGPLFDSTGAYRLLLAGARADEVAGFVNDELGPLLRSASPDDAGLVHTLRVLLDTGLSMTEAARRMNLTRQAVYYRKERLESLLGASLSEPEKRLSLSLALRALDLVHLKPGFRDA